MSSLAGKKPKDTFKQLLHIGADNIGLQTETQTVHDGNGNATPLKISTTKIGVGDLDDVEGAVEELFNRKVVNEVPSGLINGANVTFTTAFQFQVGSLALRVNGLQQKLIDDYQTIGNNTIQLTFSPAVGESIEVDYFKIRVNI